MKGMVVRFIATCMLALAGASAALSVPLPDLLPAGFLESLTPAARLELASVRAVYIPLMRHPMGFYVPAVRTVFYGPAMDTGNMRHEAMHVLDPCRLERSCSEAFAATLPADLRQTAQDLYGELSWSSAEYWPVLPAWYLWDPSMMPSDVAAAYSEVFQGLAH